MDPRADLPARRTRWAERVRGSRARRPCRYRAVSTALLRLAAKAAAVGPYRGTPPPYRLPCRPLAYHRRSASTCRSRAGEIACLQVGLVIISPVRRDHCKVLADPEDRCAESRVLQPVQLVLKSVRKIDLRFERRDRILRTVRDDDVTENESTTDGEPLTDPVEEISLSFRRQVVNSQGADDKVELAFR